MAKTAYQLYANTDMDEGKGRPFAIPGLFANLDVAHTASIGRGVYGSAAEIREVLLFETVDEFEQWTKEQDPDYREYLRLKQRFE